MKKERSHQDILPLLLPLIYQIRRGPRAQGRKKFLLWIWTKFGSFSYFQRWRFRHRFFPDVSQIYPPQKTQVASSTTLCLPSLTTESIAPHLHVSSNAWESCPGDSLNRSQVVYWQCGVCPTSVRHLTPPLLGILHTPGKCFSDNDRETRKLDCQTLEM